MADWVSWIMAVWAIASTTLALAYRFGSMQGADAATIIKVRAELMSEIHLSASETRDELRKVIDAAVGRIESSKMTRELFDAYRDSTERRLTRLENHRPIDPYTRQQ